MADYQTFAGAPISITATQNQAGTGPAQAVTSDAGAFGNLLSLGGTGLGIYNQQNQYNTLQNALNTIGPTQLQGFNMGGPGGMSSGYNPATGSANINLGSLNPAFSGFAGAAGTGSNGYNAGLPSFLSSSALSTLSPSLSTLQGAYGNYGAGMTAAGTQLNNLGDFNTTYNNMLQAQYGQLAPQIQQSAFGLQNTLFGNGVADSTGAASGSLAAQNFGRGVGQAQSTAQLNAYQAAMQQQNSAAANYGTLTNSANGILANAFNNFGNTNQLISGLNTSGLNNAATAAQGAGALNTVGLNNYNAALSTGVGQGQVRNGSLFPYASVATALANQPNALSGLGAALGIAGNSLGGSNGGGLSQLLNLGKQGYNYLTGAGNGAGVGGVFDPSYGGFIPDNTSTAANALSSWQEGAAPGLYNNSGFMDLSGFNSAGGGAASAADQAALAAADPTYAAGLSDIPLGAGAGTGAGAAGFAGAGGDALGTQAAAEAGASFGSAGGGSSALGSIGAAALPAGIALGGLYGLDMIFNNQGGNPYSASQGLKSSAGGLNTVANNLLSGAAPNYGPGSAQQTAQALQNESANVNQLSQLWLTNPQLAAQILGGSGKQGNGIFGYIKQS